MPLFILLKSDPAIIVVILLGVVVVLLLTYFFSRKAIVHRALRKQQERKIGDLQDGETGKVIGRVVFAGQTLTAPLSRRKCSYYHVVVQQYRSNGKSGSWHTIIDDERKGDVVIHDGLHYAVIDTRNVKSYLVPDANYSSGTFEDATPELEQYLAAHGTASENFLGFNKSLRYREGVLEEGELFAVSGQGYWNAKDRRLNLNTNRVLVITTGEQSEKVYLSDDSDVTEG